MYSISQFLALASSIPPAVAFCGGHTHLDTRADEVPISTFGYSATNGPLLWSSLSPQEYGDCSKGKNQSPINLQGNVYKEVPGRSISLTLPDVENGAAVFENLGSTVEVAMVGTGGSIKLDQNDTTIYDIQQFHFHNPSEHLENGVDMPMEMHIVFQQETNIAVVGILVDLEPANNQISIGRGKRSKRAGVATTTTSPLLQTVFSQVDEISTPGTETNITQPLLMSEIVRHVNSGSLKTYSGSLTTPPCSENVAWFVSDKHLKISTDTFMKARNVIGFNARYAQNAPGEPNLLELASQQEL